MRRSVVLQCVSAVAIMALFGGCSKDDSNGPNTASGILAKIIAVQTSGGTVGVIKSGSAPTAQSGGPAAAVASAISMINGGTSAVMVTSTGSMAKVIVGVPGVDDYYEVTLPAEATSVQLLITLAQDLTGTTLPLKFQAGDGTGKYGTAAQSTATLTQVGTGDVQVSVSWDTPTDVDLHVLGPDGVEIYYGNPIASTGATLDLDSNAGCGIDHVNNENITWPTGHAPSGTYTVRVDYWSACSVASTNYVVTIRVTGKSPQVFTGSFTGIGDGGAAGSGRLITTFTK